MTLKRGSFLSTQLKECQLMAKASTKKAAAKKPAAKKPAKKKTAKKK